MEFIERVKNLKNYLILYDFLQDPESILFS